MNVLVLGGTRFVGRHIVEQLAADGDRLVVLHRGKSAASLPEGVEERLDDRDADLSAAESQSWDAIVDTCAYRPEQLDRSLRLRTGHYLFVSTVNVYRDLSVRGVSEEAATIEAFDPSDEAAAYGGNKAACERLVMQRHPARSTILRPGLIAGRWDYTGRFTYWCERLLRGGRVLAPGDPNRRIQFIDAADIARFAAHALAQRTYGTFNVVGPAVPTTMAELLRDGATVAAERGGSPATFAWADESFLRRERVAAWLEMPLWLDEPQYAGVLEIGNAKALEAGLTTRPIAATVRSVLDWIDEDPYAKRAGLSPEREAELLAKLA